MMKRITVEISAYILTLYPNCPRAAAASKGTAKGVKGLKSLAMGLAVPSFWSRKEILDTFVEANRIWIREAEIEFKPIRVSQRDEVVPADETRMWPYFLRHLKPTGKGIGVGFVHDLPGDEGGWGGGRIVVLSGEKARAGLAGNAGNLLAHELGHVLIDDPEHKLAKDNHNNLMYKSRNARVANAGILNTEQKQKARERAEKF
jgi:hypothetical protein